MSEFETARAAVNAVPKRLFVGGEWRDASSGGTFAVEDPATGETLCAVADATPADGLAALDAAVAAQPSWAATPPRERGEILRRAYDLAGGNLDDQPFPHRPVVSRHGVVVAMRPRTAAVGGRRLQQVHRGYGALVGTVREDPA